MTKRFTEIVLKSGGGDLFHPNLSHEAGEDLCKALTKSPTKNEELCALLDLTFDNYPARPDFAAIRELAFTSKHSSWLITELLKAMWLYSEDFSAFEEFLWRITNE